MGRSRQPRGRERIRNRATASYKTPVGDTDITGIAVALFLAFVAMICAFSPRYLEFARASVGTILFDGAAVTFGLVGLGGLLYEIYLIRGSFTPNLDAWASAFIAVFFALLAIAVHLVTVIGLGLTGWLETGAKVIVILLCLPFALALAATIDGFFIKPRLGKNVRKAQRQSRNRLIGNIGAVILWALTVISTALTLLDRFFGG